MRRGDALRVGDILEAIEKIERWSRTAADDDLYRAGVSHELSVIGEAAAHLSSSVKRTHAGVPWARVVGLRNVLVHEYWGTARSVLERIVSEELPRLRDALRGAGPSAVSPEIDELLAVASRRPAFGLSRPGERPGKQQRSSESERVCGAWMPIARARCVLRAGHYPGTHHRSR